MNSENDKLRQRSGSVKDSNNLVSFLYLLMRDELTPGKVERLVRESQGGESHFTNGWLAEYAKDLANRLKDV